MNQINIAEIRADFPILQKLIGGKPLVYLDSTATALKPKAVLDAINGYYVGYSANVFRGIYKISERATAEYEKARRAVAGFIHAAKVEEVVFTRNTSESLNFVYYTWAKRNIVKDDEIVTSIMEHHSNFVPWQQLALTTGCKLKIWETDHNYLLDYEKLKKLITPKTKLLAITSMSNVLGTLVDIKKAVEIAKTINPQIIVLVDAAQTVPHLPVDVQDWKADFVAFSGHKMLGPTGIGVLWGRLDLLESLPPFQLGGDMISEVHVDHTEFNQIPHRFEAGTPHIAGVIGLGAAATYLEKIGMTAVRQHEMEITDYALKKLTAIKGINIYGPGDASQKGGVIAFTVAGVHPHDVAQILDDDNVCVRVGFHCAQPLHEYLGCGPTVRASFYIYTTKDDIDALSEGLDKVIKIFK